MARNQDRQFSVSDSLRALDLGGRDENTAPRELPRGDEPEQPAPARREGREKRPAPPPEADPATIADPAQTSDPAPKEAEAAVPEEAEALQEEKPSVPEEAESAPAQDDAQRERNARQAWNQEARRVDGEHPGLARDAWAAEDAAAGRGKKQPTQGAEKPEKRGRKKKKKKKKTDERQSFIKTLVIVFVCAFLFLSVALMVVSNFVSSPLLALPRKAVTAIITPVQRVFAQVTGSVVDYLRMLKICTELTGRDDLYEKNGLEVLKRVEEIKSDLATAGIPDEKRRVLVLRAASTFVKAKNSEGTVLGQMLADLGCINIADSDESLLENLSVESVLRDEPYRIFVVTMGSDTEAAIASFDRMISENPAWSSLGAIKEGRVYHMEKRLFNQKPNARWDEAYEKLSDILKK